MPPFLIPNELRLRHVSRLRRQTFKLYATVSICSRDMLANISSILHMAGAFNTVNRLSDRQILNNSLTYKSSYWVHYTRREHFRNSFEIPLKHSNTTSSNLINLNLQQWTDGNQANPYVILDVAKHLATKFFIALFKISSYVTTADYEDHG